MVSRPALIALVAGMIALLASCSSSNLNSIYNPTPVIQLLSPDFATANELSASGCSSGPTLNVNISGSGFITTSQAQWNGSNRTTSLNVNTNQLLVTLFACDLTTPGKGQITVVNPPPGGGPTEFAATFEIDPPLNPVPIIGSITPTSTAVGVLPPNGILEIDAASGDALFNSNSVVSFNGNMRTTTLVSPSELQAQVLTSDVASNASINITVSNPSSGGGGGVSLPVVFTVGAGGAAHSQFPQVVSIGALGGPANGASAAPAASADGRYVAFYSQAKNLVAEGASGNIFLRDTCMGATNCIPQTLAVDLSTDSNAPNGLAGDHVALSANGRFVAFVSSASNLVPGGSSETNAGGLPPDSHVFVRDMCVGSDVPSGCTPHTALLSMDAKGNPVHGLSPSISGDGRFVAFVSWNRNLPAASSEGTPEVFVRDTCTGLTAAAGCVAKTLRVPMDSQNQTGWAGGAKPAISSDGRYIAFEGWSPRFAASDGSLQTRIFLRDTCQGAGAPAGCIPGTIDVSISPNGSPLGGMNMFPAISGRGRFVIFVTQAAGASSTESAAPQQLLMRDTCLGPTAPDACVPNTTLISGGTASIPGYPSAFSPWISASGRYVTFVAGASETSNNGQAPYEGYLFVRDTCFGASAGCTARTSLIAAPGAAAQGSGLGVYKFSSVPLTADGRFAVFFSPYAVPASPASGFGDVYLTTTSN
jgi:Tol biopolymer transport system component